MWLPYGCPCLQGLPPLVISLFCYLTSEKLAEGAFTVSCVLLPSSDWGTASLVSKRKMPLRPCLKNRPYRAQSYLPAPIPLVCST